MVATQEANDQGASRRVSIRLTDDSPRNVILLRQAERALVNETLKAVLNLLEAVTPTDAQYARVRAQAFDLFGKLERNLAQTINSLARGDTE